MSALPLKADIPRKNRQRLSARSDLGPASEIDRYPAERVGSLGRSLWQLRFRAFPRREPRFNSPWQQSLTIVLEERSAGKETRCDPPRNAEPSTKP